MKALSTLLISGLFAGTLGTDTSAGARKLRQTTRKLQDNLIQVDEYECSYKTESFGSAVLLDFHMDVSALDETVIAALEAGFVESYRELVFALCDVPNFRTVSDVEIEVLANTDESMYYDFTNDLFKETNRTHILKVSVLAECRECEDDIIFSGVGVESENSVNLALVEPDALSVITKSGERKSKYGTCVCPAGAAEKTYVPDMRTPTEAEFYAIFNALVADLQNDALPATFDLFEAEKVDCESHTEDFASTVFVRFEGDLSTLGDADIVTLEEAFIATYNGLNFAYCDYPHFRTITNATLDRSSLSAARKMRKLQNDTLEETSIEEETPTEAPGPNVVLDFSQNVLLVDPPFGVNTLKFLISAECRDCDGTTPLFSFDSNNMSIAELIETLPPIESLLGRNNFLQGDSGYCYCPAHPEPLYRAPTTDEFQAAYNVTLTTLKAAGALDAVAALQDVLETTEVQCAVTKTEFTSTVFVELDKPLEMLSEFEKFTIEDSFLQSYNALTFSTCDQYFREAAEVTIISASSRRRERLLQGGTESDTNLIIDDEDTTANVTKDRYPAVFNVLARCRECEVDDSGSFELFDDTFDASTRRLVSSERLSSSIIFGSSVAPAFQGPDRWLMESGSQDSRLQVCACPADVPPDGTLSPTNEAFIDIFNGRITDLAEAGILTGFGLVEDLVEAADICDGGTFYSFLDRYELGFSGDIESIPDSVLAEIFRVAYNSQRPEDCDPLVASTNVIQRSGVPMMQVSQDDVELSFVRLMVDTLQLEMGDIFRDDGVLERFIAAYNALLSSQGHTAVLVTAMFDPSMAPSSSPSDVPSHSPTNRPSVSPSRSPSLAPSSEPSSAPSRSPSSAPSKSPSQTPSAPPSIPPSMVPSVLPTLNRAMCNDKITELTDSVIIDYSITRLADINLPFGMKMPELDWPLQEPATLIAAEEYIAAYNKLQKKVFCDPFHRWMTSVTCVSTENNALSGSLCCTVHFNCIGNCEKFIFPDRDPIGAYYDQPGFEYPTDESCTCDLENSPDRAPSASEHFDMINDNVPLEILSFAFRGFATDSCPK